jgi:predicted Fe-S protein YdhL (DUF1289 family)
MGIETPCVGICVIDERSGLCTGCLRSRDEIAGWIRLAPEARRQIMDALPSRRMRRERSIG